MDNVGARRPKSRFDQPPLDLATNLDVFPAATVLIDLDELVVGWNAAAERLFGLPAEATVGRRVRDLDLSRRLPQLRRALEEFRARPEAKDLAEVVSDDRRAMGVRPRLAPIFDDQGRVAALLLTVGESTADLRARLEEEQEELRLAKERLRAMAEEVRAAQEVDRKKDEFLAMLAHELRNPLAPILAALHVIGRESPGNRYILHARTTAERQVKQLGRLLEDLLDIARITQQKIELRRERCKLSDVVEAALETARHLFQMGSLGVTTEPSGEDLWIDGDFARLVQVVGNLLNNAAKYTGPGGTVHVVSGRAGDKAVLRIADTGVGIDRELLPHVFELFRQGEMSLARSRGGLGVGLTLVQSLVGLHGGSVEAHSEGVGRGSEFVVRFPLASSGPAASSHDRKASNQVSSGPRRVLVIEDSRDAREMLKLALELEGHSVLVALDGPTGLKAALAEAPDAALIDIGLPGLDGYEVARRIRTGLGSTVLLVALTGYGDAEARDRARQAGFDLHLVKPVDPLDLVGVIERGASGGRAS